MTDYLAVYRDGHISEPCSWERLLFLVRQARGLPWSFRVAFVLPATLAATAAAQGGEGR